MKSRLLRSVLEECKKWGNVKAETNWALNSNTNRHMKYCHKGDKIFLYHQGKKKIIFSNRNLLRSLKINKFKTAYKR
jgi:hypothetical protein